MQYMCYYGKYRARCNFNKWEALLKVRAEIAGETQVFWLANRQEADLSRTPRQDVECSATAKTPVLNRKDFKPVLLSNPFIEIGTGGGRKNLGMPLVLYAL